VAANAVDALSLREDLSDGQKGRLLLQDGDRWIAIGLPDLAQVLFVYAHGAVPVVLLQKASLAEALPREIRAAAVMLDTPVKPIEPVWLTLFTSMFLHGDLLHIGFNMLYLWVFGNNVEDILGHFRFLVFYLGCGLLAALAQILMSLDSAVPMIGASGAIAGVLGAYYKKFPRARVRCLVFLFVFVTVVMLPAGLVLLLWFLIQVRGSLVAQGGQGGVAFFAHIGGFVAGWLFVRSFELKRRPRLTYLPR
jgi:membrane associated rhomboid family serine protease